ncbi:cyclin-like protein [Globomyces pollinis-pini]|nr:cyclin-like protein [Globomyces pollinis-pini]
MEDFVDSFYSSSQSNHWIYKADKLLEIRQKSNEAACERVKKSWDDESKLSNLKYNINLISVEEQMKLVRFYESKIKTYCRSEMFQLDRNIEATSMLLYKRFYISASVMEYDPKLIVLTCIFLSTKIEHQQVALVEFLNKIPRCPITPNDMLDLELIVTTHLNFELMVYHPYWPLHGYFLDLQSYIQEFIPVAMKQHYLQAIYNMYTTATGLIFNAYMNDTPLLYSPSQIALACLHFTATNDKDPKSKMLQLLSKYISWRFKSQDPTILATLHTLLNEIGNLIGEVKIPEREEVAVIAKKADGCFSRTFTPSSLLYKNIIHH